MIPVRGPVGSMLLLQTLMEHPALSTPTARSEQDDTGSSPLHYVVRLMDPNNPFTLTVAKLLLDGGVDPLLRDVEDKDVIAYVPQRSQLNTLLTKYHDAGLYSKQ